MRRAFLLVLAGATGGCFVGTLDLSGFACDANHPCLDGWTCVDGGTVSSCQLSAAPGLPDGGSSGGIGGSCVQAPACNATGTAVLLCDGGVFSCGSGNSCDFTRCFPSCTNGKCASGDVCDAVGNACVQLASCNGGGTSCTLSNGSDEGTCVSSVCAPNPTLAQDQPGSCNGLTSGAPITVIGVVSLFPYADATSTLYGGTVTFIGADGGLATGTIGDGGGGFPWYSTTTQLSPGVWTALVQKQGVILPTYFPNLVVSAKANGSAARLDLNAVVPTNLEIAGVSATPGHLTWAVRLVACNNSGYLDGVTLGLSPQAGFVGYYGSAQTVDPAQATTTSSRGEAVAADAPYAPTQYVLANLTGASPQALLSGTFTPPPYSPGTEYAVALIYPNASQ